MRITTDMIVGTGLVIALLAAIFVAVAQSCRRRSAYNLASTKRCLEDVPREITEGRMDR